MSPASTIKMTAEQFLELGEDPVGMRLELVDGEVAVSPSPIPKHSIAVTMVCRILTNYIFPKGIGEVLGDVDTIFGEHDVRCPDIIYFSKNRLHLIGEKSIEGPPDLCVEIISPSSREIDRKKKFKQYARGKVANYWIVDPEPRTIEAYQLSGRSYKLVGQGSGNQTVFLPPFPELEIPLGELWRPRLGE
jgi:Uma2 family endonuclease